MRTAAAGEALRRAADALSGIDGVRLYGPADRAGALSFAVEGVHHYDLGTLIDQMGVAVRTGHHCAMPVMEFFGVPGTARASLALYNTESDVDQLVTAIEILSPFNKRAGEGIDDYRRKRTCLLRSSVHLIEIDLLRRGERPGRELLEQASGGSLVMGSVPAWKMSSWRPPVLVTVSS